MPGLRKSGIRSLGTVFGYQGGGSTGKQGCQINGPFNEFQLFTNIRSLSKRAFQDSMLTELALPVGIAVIPDFAFTSLASRGILVKCDLHEGITRLGQYAMSGTGIPIITVPSTVTIIGDRCFSGYVEQTIVFMPLTPPTLETDNAFGDSSSTRSKKKIYVPDESLEAYKSAQYWSTVANRIFPMSELYS